MHDNTVIPGSNARWFSLARVGLFLVLALLIPSIGLPQPITGSLVNALLLLAVETSGLGTALVVGMITPMVALLHGVLPLPLLVMIPFIAVGNATLASVHYALRPRGRWLALAAAAATKFMVLFAAVTWLVARPLNLMIGGSAQLVALPTPFGQMMSWPQLGTALSGGLIAFGVLWLAERK